MNRSLFTDLRREIRRSLARYCSILLMIALGCMFFGAAGSQSLPREVFGILERLSTYSAVVFTGILGVYWRGALRAEAEKNI